MLAKRIPTILPPMSFEESLETTRIHSVTGVLPSETGLITTRPFRSPHHTISDAGLVGGGSLPRTVQIFELFEMIGGKPTISGDVEHSLPYYRVVTL
jgi:predicted ATPase with chaperone activity